MTGRQFSRHKTATTFTYTDGTEPISDELTLARIASLAIPPAWTDVKIAKNVRAKVQASGRDNAGRLQSIYHPNFRARQEAAKYDRIVSFGRNLPRLRRQVKRDLARRRYDKRKVVACAISLMDQTYFRVGNSTYAKSNAHYGLTTLRSKHVSVSGDTVIFDFIGKSGQQQHKKVTDRTLARMIARLDDMPGYELFRYYDSDNTLHNLTSSDINTYIKDAMGDEYSAKDFRTWGGTLVACMELAKLARPDTKTARKKAMTVMIKRVARKLGNTPAVTRSSYIDPRVITMFDEGDRLGDLYRAIAKIKESHYFSRDEAYAMKVLSSH